MDPAVVLDVDGTLVDSNYQHAIAWSRAFRESDVSVPIWRIHRHIGMGGDQLVASVAGDDVEARCGKTIREAEKRLYMELIDEVAVLPGARGLIEALATVSMPVVLASSAKAEEVDRYLDLLGARGLVDAWTTSEDVERTKPEPDLVRCALAKAETDDGLMIGDTTWDVEAARRAGIPAVAVLTGGFCAAELRDSGAVAVYESAVELLAELDSLLSSRNLASGNTNQK
jgi:HAD superfamily hydrolase (TIGR01509 family)